MNDECLVCGAPLEYLGHAVSMECTVCHGTFLSSCRCERGHFVCDACHAAGSDALLGICAGSSSTDPVEIVELLMDQPWCHMHGPEHHVMVGAALLTAYANAGGDLDLPEALREMLRRGREVPGGACGYWGACGAGVSAGMFVAIASGSSPLAAEPFALANTMTSRALSSIGEVGGPRCCKRDSYLAIIAAAGFSAERLGVRMDLPERVSCSRFLRNNQCLGGRCPFFPTSGG